MKHITVSVLLIFTLTIPALAGEGLVTVPSSYSVEKTADRMESILTKKGMTIFNRIKHSEGAAKIGIKLRNTELILFGNPKVGSPLMKCQQSVAIDLPQKALIWEDDKNVVWISYNDPQYLRQRHDIIGCDAVISKIEKALAGITKAAGSPMEP